MASDDGRQQFLRSISDAPHDPALRSAFADWLAARGEETEAQFHRWLEQWLRETKGQMTLFARPGDLVEAAIDWHWLGADPQLSMQSRVRNLFRERPQLQFVVVSELPHETCGLRRVACSPIAHWHRPNDQVSAVVPLWTPVAEEPGIAEFTRREADRSAAGSGEANWGELFRPEWV